MFGLQQIKILDAFTLKVIAILAMTIDHIGAFLYPEDLWFRIVGRLTIPIIAFLIVEGYHHTSNIKRYLLRLFGFALLAQPVYWLMLSSGLNVLFDLLIGMGVTLIIDRYKLGWLKYLFVACVSLIAIYISLDWWHLAILMIFIFNQWRGNFKAIAFGILTLFTANYLLFALVANTTANQSVLLTHTTNLYCIATLPLIYLYNGVRGKDYRYFFYLYYPSHFLFIYLIKINCF